MRGFLSGVLVFMLVSPSAQAQEKPRTQTPKQQITALNQGQSLEVRRIDGSKVRGYLGPVSEGGFVVLTNKQDAGAKVDISYFEVKSIKLSPWGWRRKTIAITVGAVVALGVFITIVYMQSRKPLDLRF